MIMIGKLLGNGQVRPACVGVEKAAIIFGWPEYFLPVLMRAGHLKPLGRPSQNHGRTRGTIADCDFTGARLDLVSFNNCDLNTIKLPRWPHFTITDPSTTVGRIPNPLDCQELETLKSTCLAQKPVTKGITCYAPFLLEPSQLCPSGRLLFCLRGQLVRIPLSIRSLDD